MQENKRKQTMRMGFLAVTLVYFISFGECTCFDLETGVVKISLVPGVAAIEKVLKTYVVACGCSGTVVGAAVLQE